MKTLGLIGKTLTHSFSKSYFEEKFKQENLAQAYRYLNFELEEISKFTQLVKDLQNPLGFNVTIPYKQAIIPYLDDLDSTAKSIQAVNTIKIVDGKKLTGYNTDVIGFRESLLSWLPDTKIKALVLGSGGASQAVQFALSEVSIDHLVVSRTAVEKQGHITYTDLQNNPTLLQQHRLLINTTPLGTFPNTNECPALPYQQLTENHYLYDLVYNPSETLFMQKGTQQGAFVKNGYQMLVLQAEAAWRIWQEPLN